MLKRVIREEHKVPADINYLGEMRDFITQVGRKYGVSERVINAFKLAIDEAGTNIIRHAYRDWEGFVTIRMVIRGKSVTVSLIDQGHTFDLRNVKDPDLQRYVDIGKKGGLGIFIIRRVIDEIDYRKTFEGNELRLTKQVGGGPKKQSILSGLSITMKTRFSMVASGILTVLVVGGFIWTFIQQEEKVRQEKLAAGWNLAKSLANQARSPLVKDYPWELARIAAEIYHDHSPEIVEALVVDETDTLQGAAVRTDQILEPFRLPMNSIKKSSNIYEYKLPDNKTVFDLVEPIIAEVVPKQIGTVHLLMDKALIDRAIASAREKTFIIFGLVLLLGYVGIFGLVYVTMSPFKRLAKWVSALGRGEIHEEMEFDSSDEIGEIAQAFNEITEKFRKSQENLAEQERLQKEMQVAQEIQHTLLPSSFPDIEGYEIASYYEAAKEVGGDYYDFVEVDKDTIGIVVADVSGKGVPGSLVMTMIRTALRTEARGNKNAADVLARVNDFVINDMKRGMFVTVFYMILDSHSRTINYASAGHNPMILFRGKTRKSYYLNPRGFPIGINLPDRTLFRKSIESDTLQLREGDVLICYTDGITEAMNLQRDRFGEERFLSVIRKHGDLKVDPLVDNIRNQITEFTEGYAQSDDITLVAIREKMRAEDVLFNLRSKLLKLVKEEKMSVKEACKNVGVSTSTFYKYKKRFEKMGMAGLKEQTIRSKIEEKHISIEDKAKIFDIIRENPDYGAKRISELLNTEKYGFTEIDEKRLYDELVRNRLNTRELRVAFIERGGRGKRMKPPGTPFLTLDGQVIVESKIKTRPKVVGPTIVDEEIKPIEESVETEKTSGIRISQKSKESFYTSVEEEEKAEAHSLLEEFLGLSEESEKKMDTELAQEKKNTLEVTDGLQDASVTVSEEIPTADRKIETVPEKEGIDSFIDELNWDLAELEEGMKSPESLSHSSVEQILNSNEDGLTNEVRHQIEETITSSVGGELFEEEMGNFFDKIGTEESDRDGYLETTNNRYDSLIGVKGLTRKRFFESGQYYYRQGMYAKAIDEFRKAIETDSTFSEAHQFLGDAYFRLGQLEKAGEAYEKVRQLDPDNVNVLENLGVIFANRGDYKKAVWQWGEVLKRNPERRDIIDRIKRMQRVIRQRSI